MCCGRILKMTFHYRHPYHIITYLGTERIIGFSMNRILSKNDYEEPRCLLNMHPETVRIPVGRMIEKLDDYVDRKDYAAAERHLEYWLKEAENDHDREGRLTVLNEQIGLYRKIGKERECLLAISDALALADNLEMENTVAYATTLINAATGYKAFGRAEAALPLYRKAQINYESNLRADDGRLGGLYNNMALTLTEMKEYREAEKLFRQAIEVMKRQ